MNQSQHEAAFGSGAGGEGGPVVGNEATQVASIAPEAPGPVYADQSSDPGGGYQPDVSGMSAPVEPTVSDQPAGTEHVDPLS